MSRSEAFVRVDCDECSESVEVPLTRLAGMGQWDERNLVKWLTRNYWFVDGQRHRCESCVDAAKAEA